MHLVDGIAHCDAIGAIREIDHGIQKATRGGAHEYQKGRRGGEEETDDYASSVTPASPPTRNRLADSAPKFAP
jgi:hypothetical protein